MMDKGPLEWARSRHPGSCEPWIDDSFLAGLPADSMRRLERYGEFSRATENVDLSVGVRPVVIVLSGTVRVFHARWGGKETLVQIAGRGDFVHMESAPGSAVRLVDERLTGILVVPRKRFLDLCAQDEEINDAYVRTLQMRVQELTAQVGHTGRRVEHRLYAFLVALTRRHGWSLSNGKWITYITQADLAAAIGATTSSVELAVRRLREAGRLSNGFAYFTLYGLPADEELDRVFSPAVADGRG